MTKKKKKRYWEVVSHSCTCAATLCTAAFIHNLPHQCMVPDIYY